MSVRTGAFGYLQYGYETTYGTISSAITKVLGLEQKATSWGYTNNKIVLSEFNQVQPIKFAYGQARGDLGVDFVLSNPWWLNSLYDLKSGAGPFTYTVSSKLIKPITVEIGIDNTTDTVRMCRGSFVNSISLRSSIGDVVRCSADIAYSIESTQAIDAVPAVDDIAFPYTFAHGTLEMPDGTLLAQVQSVDLTLTQNGELLYAHGSNQAVGAYRKLFEITGRFNLSHVDYVQLNKVYAQIGINAQTQLSEQPTLALKFTNGLSAGAERTIDFQATGIALDSFNVSVEPNEPIFEDIPFQARTSQVVATGGTEP